MSYLARYLKSLDTSRYFHWQMNVIECHGFHPWPHQPLVQDPGVKCGPQCCGLFRQGFEMTVILGYGKSWFSRKVLRNAGISDCEANSNVRSVESKQFLSFLSFLKHWVYNLCIVLHCLQGTTTLQEQFLQARAADPEIPQSSTLDWGFL